MFQGKGFEGRPEEGYGNKKVGGANSFSLTVHLFILFGLIFYYLQPVLIPGHPKSKTDFLSWIRPGFRLGLYSVNRNPDSY